MGYLYHINWSTGEFAGFLSHQRLYHPSFSSPFRYRGHREERPSLACFCFCPSPWSGAEKKDCRFGGVHDSPRWSNRSLKTWHYIDGPPTKNANYQLWYGRWTLRCFDSFLLWCTSQCCRFKAVKRSLKRITVLSTVLRLSEAEQLHGISSVYGKYFLQYHTLP